MEFIVVVLPLLVSLHLLNRQQQQLRIQRLAALLRPLALEKLMEQLNTGYLRALGESDPVRSEPIWRLLTESEQRFGEQLQRLAEDAARLNADQTRISRWPVWAALAARWLPANSFDLRDLLRIHARGVAEVLRNPRGLTRRDQAFMLSADMLLFQHTSHAQALDAASPTTRSAYRALLQMD